MNKGRLFYELLALVLVPLLIVGIFSLWSCVRISQSTGFNVEMQALDSGTALIEERIQRLAPEGDFSYKDNVLSKGDYVLDNTFIDELGSITDLHCSIFIGDVRALTTITAENGDRLINRQMDSEVWSKVKSGETVHNLKLDINGEDYIVSYSPLYNDSKEVIGSIFVGKTRADVIEFTHDEVSTTSLILVSILVIVIVISLIIVVKLIAAITKNTNYLNVLKDRDLTFELDEKLLNRKDAIGDISRACEEVLNSQKNIMGAIKESSLDLVTQSEALQHTSSVTNDNLSHIESSINEVSKGAMNQAEDTQRATEASIEIANLVEKTKNLTEDLEKSTNKMINENEKIINKFDELSKANENSNKAIEDISVNTNSTNKSVLEISKALDLIADISSQINLLSLNASIESARAGESGRGFAVIANEIRNLSDETKQNAVTIEKIVKTLTESSLKSVESIEEVQKAMLIQNETLKETQNNINQNNIVLNEAVEKVNEISDYSNNLINAKNVITDILNNLAAISEENAAAAQETSAYTTQSLTALAELNEAISQLNSLSALLETEVSKYKM